MRGRILLGVLVAAMACAACGDDHETGDGDDAPLDAGPTCEAASVATFASGDPTGHLQPLLAGENEARAGRLAADELPPDPAQLLTWAAGDYVLANAKIALVIENAGPSDLYDPWGGKPVGIARIAGGHMVEPSRFGEVFLLTGRSSLATDTVSVLHDGSDGGPAVIRAHGFLQATPFFDSLTAGIYPDVYSDIESVIDYSLAPGADHVEVTVQYANRRPVVVKVPSTLRGMMYGDRMPVFQPNLGFDPTIGQSPYAAFVDERATSWAYAPGDGNLDTGISTNGFIGSFGPGFEMPACAQSGRLLAKLVIGGPGLDNVVAAAGRALGIPEREITGTVARGSQLIANATVHATDANGNYLTHALTNSTGQFVLHVPPDAEVKLEAIKLGLPTGTLQVGTASGPVTIPVGASAAIHVAVQTADQGSVPIRVQILPGAGTTVPPVPANYGMPEVASGRLDVAFALAGDITIDVPPGTWEVIVSHGYEYELLRQTVTVAADEIAQITGTLEHSVPTPNVQCADFHVHTWRSNDSGDDSLEKLRQAVSDGLELPVRSDHEWVSSFADEIAQLHLEPYAAGFPSVELTSFQYWGHMGVFPLVADPTQQNNGAPKWQSYPSPESPDTPFETLSPPAVFDMVRARAEQPVVIINHPRGGADYFNYVGFDPATGLVDDLPDWDTKFTLVEVFNNSGWQHNRPKTVADWLALLKAGRKVFAVGSSDSHQLSTSPVGYPRTCLALGTDDPRLLTANQVRDTLAAGHAVVSGGIYVDAAIAGVGPGDTTTGAGNPQQVDVTVRAASWVDVDAIEVIVDGTTVDTIPIMPTDADPENPAIRWQGSIPVTTLASGGFVVIAAYGDQALEPVHPGRMPFGVTNPIFVVP